MTLNILTIPRQTFKDTLPKALNETVSLSENLKRV